MDFWNDDICYAKGNWVVVWNIFYFHRYLGKISNLTNIFQRGWNHQLGNVDMLIGGGMEQNKNT